MKITSNPTEVLSAHVGNSFGVSVEGSEPAPFNTVPLEKIDAIDTSGEHRLLRKIFRSFEESSVAGLEKMRRRIEEEDWEELRKVAHGLKGSSLQLGAEELGALCRELEERTLEGRRDETVRLFERITVSLEGVLSFLRNYEASLDGCAPESLAQSPGESRETS